MKCYTNMTDTLICVILYLAEVFFCSPSRFCQCAFCLQKLSLFFHSVIHNLYQGPRSKFGYHIHIKLSLE